jgi:DNA-binding NtrC family response regulator
MSERRPRILVVDDEAPIMNLCLKVLQLAGHSVTGLNRGEDVLAQLSAAPVELLVVDYKMPGIDGFEVIRRARRLQPGIKIVLMTGHGTQSVMGEASQKSLEGILVKPFTPDELNDAVTNALASGKTEKDFT